MHVSTLILPLLAAAPAISAARLGPHVGRRSTSHPIVDFDKVRREGTKAMEAREGITRASSSMKGKRLVRKKRSGNSGCQVPFSNTSAVTDTYSATATLTNAATGSITAAVTSATTVIGQNQWADAQSSSTSAVWAEYTSSSTAWADATTSTTQAWAAQETSSTSSPSASATASSNSNSDWYHVDTWVRRSQSRVRIMY